MSISVVIPAFNAERTVEETIRSVLAQKHAPEEILLIDDGSTDDTAGKAKRFPSPVRVVSQANLGQPAAINHGIRQAVGTHLAFIDADDLWSSDKLSQQMAAFADDPTLDGVFGHMRSFACPTATVLERQRWQIPDEPQPGWVLGTLLIRRTAVDRVGLFDERFRIGAAIEWLARLRDTGMQVRMLADVVLRRRIHAGSMSQRSSSRDSGYMKLVRARLQQRRGG